MTPNSAPVTKRTAVHTSQLVHLTSTNELLEPNNSEFLSFNSSRIELLSMISISLSETSEQGENFTALPVRLQYLLQYTL